jgi:hypothetical protein
MTPGARLRGTEIDLGEELGKVKDEYLADWPDD